MKYLKRAQEIENYKSQQKELRKSVSPVINPDDIYTASWGYDQTQVDYFQVVEKVSTHFALIQLICSEEVPGSQGRECCKVVPKKGAFVNGTEPFKAKVSCRPTSDGADQHQYIKIDSVSTAFPDSGKPSYRSWYR